MRTMSTPRTRKHECMGICNTDKDACLYSAHFIKPCKITMTLPNVIFLNNKGVSFLRKGDIKEAQRCFVKAINGILSNGERKPCYDGPEPSSTPESQIDGCFRHERQSEKQLQKDFCKNSSLPLHLQGVRVSEDDFVLSNDDVIICGVLGAAVLFNFAVSHHVLAQYSKNLHQPPERRFLCAQQLYKSAQQSLAVAAGDSLGPNSQQNLMQYLFLATANNSGMISLEMAHYDNAREAFECIDYYCRLFDCQVNENDVDEDGRNDQMEMLQLRNFFLLNAMCYCNTMQAAAA